MANLIIQENGFTRTRPAVNGEEITVRTPCDCSAVTGVQINGVVFPFYDAAGNNLSDLSDLFAERSLIRVMIDTDNTRAYILNRGITPQDIGAASLGEDGKVPSHQLPEISSTKHHSVVLNTNGWTEGSDGRFYQTVNVPDITADTKVVMVDVDLDTDDADAKVAYLEAWGHPAANEVTQGNGTLTFYTWEKPASNIPVNVGVM